MKTLSKIIFIFFLCAVAEAPAQDSKSRIGFKALPGFTDKATTGDNSFTDFESPRFTFNFGVQYLYTIKDPLTFIETGIYYCDRGSIEKNIEVAELGKTDIYRHMCYMSLPVLFRKECKHAYVSAGIIADYYLNSKLVFSPPIAEYGAHYNLERPDKFSDILKFGLALNIGTQIKISERTKLFIEGNLHASDLDVSDGDIYFYCNYLLGTGLTFRL